MCRSITSGRFKLDDVVLREASAGRVEATRFGRYNLPRDAASRSEGRRGRVTADANWTARWAALGRPRPLLESRPDLPARIGCQTVGFARADVERAHPVSLVEIPGACRRPLGLPDPADVRSHRRPRTGRLQPEEPAARRGNADRSAAAVPVRGRRHAAGDRSGRAARRTARAVCAIPRVLRRTEQLRFRDRPRRL